jgi:hypothetical protein
VSFFGAVHLYVVSTHRIERDLAKSDGGSLLPIREGAWARWAQLGHRRGEVDPLPPMWRLEPGPVHLGHNRSAPA